MIQLLLAVDLVEVCHPNNYNVGLLGYSPLGGGTLSGKYLDVNYQDSGKGRLSLFPGFMDRYNKSIAKVCSIPLACPAGQMIRQENVIVA